MEGKDSHFTSISCAVSWKEKPSPLVNMSQMERNTFDKYENFASNLVL